MHPDDPVREPALVADSLDDALKEIAAAPNVPLSSGPETVSLTVGTVVGGSFRVEKKLGEGGMGVVYLAHDEELERWVALKLQRRGRERGLARMAREARAMARVSHPNVVPVHEVGEHDGRLFIAMEYVRGGTVRDWLQTPRTWSEIVALFVQAGYGLHAAHAIDLVHRDFKPDNILVGEDGRPRVADFGLARAVTPKHGSEDSLSSTEGDLATRRTGTLGGSLKPSSGSVPGLSARFKNRLTQTGATVGTIAYMAPEQWLGTEVDARADQFSFCVALFEALFGVRPFEGRTAAQLLNNIQRGRIIEPPAGRRVPRRVLKLLGRGLAANPGLRFPTMLALLGRLEQRPRSRARVAVSLVALAAAAVAGATTSNSLAEEPCEAGTEHMRSLWSESAQAEAATAAEQMGKPYVTDGVARATSTLQEYSAAWVDAYIEACEATLVRKEEPEALFALRAACLAERRRAFATVTRRLQSGLPRHLESAVSSAHSLPSLGPCTNTKALGRLTPLPADPNARARVLQLQAELGELSDNARDFDYEDAVHRSQLLLDRAVAADYRPTIGAARIGMIRIQEHASRFTDDTPVREAFNDGLASGDFHLAAHAAALLAKFHAPTDEAEAHRWVSTGTALLDQVGATDRAYVSLLRADAIAYGMAHEFERAQPLFERVVELRLAHDPDDPALATAYSDLTVMWATRGDLERAAEYATEAHVRTEAALGAGHPSCASTLSNIARLKLINAQYEAALPLFEKARELLAAAYGDEYPEVAFIDFELSDLYAVLGQQERALAVLEHAVTILRTTSGPRLPARFDAELLYVQLLAESGQALAAQRELDVATASIREHSLPQQLGLALTQAARLASHRADYRAAARLGEESATILSEAGLVGGQSSAWVEAGEAHLQLEAWDEAMAAFKSGYTSAEGRPSASGYAARARLGFAQAAEGAGMVDDETIAGVRVAIEIAEAREDIGARHTAEQSRLWLSRHGGPSN